MSLPVAIREAMQALGGEATTGAVHDWIEEHYPRRWKDISTPMADLTIPRPPSSTYRDEDCFLERVGRGRYRLVE